MKYEKNSDTSDEDKKAEFGVSSMTNTLKTVGMLKPMDALRSADPLKWHYGQCFDPTKIDSNYLSFTKIVYSINLIS